MDPVTLVAAGSALLVGATAAWLVRAFAASSAFAAELRAAPRASLRDAPDGALGRFVGVVERADEVAQAPLSGRDCVAFRLVVAAQYFRGSEEHGHDVVDAERAVMRPQPGSPLLLSDARAARR